MSSPRPTYAGPTAIPWNGVTHHVWGDDEAGRVDDWIFVSSEKIHQLVFGLPAGAWFRHSPQNRTIFAADELYYVVEGVLCLANPETGEVVRLLPGEAAFFRRDTWHHGKSEGPEPLRVLELFSPPPARGTSQSYARTRPYLPLEQCRYAEDRWLGRWPMARTERAREASFHVLRPGDQLWRLEGDRQEAHVGLLVSTEHLTAGILRVLPGESTGVRRHGGDASYYVLSGTPRFEATGTTGVVAGNLEPRDGLYIPEGASYAITAGEGPAELLFGVAPGYLAKAA